MDAHSEIAAVPAPGESPTVMQALLAAIGRSVEPERRDAVATFAKSFLRRLSPDELEEAGVDALLGLVRSTFAFADGRATQASLVRVFDPTIETDGYETLGSVIQTNTDDSPFLVDSVQEELLARGIGVRRLLHPVVGTIRDEQGRLERVMSGRDASHRESVMHFELDRPLASAERDDLERRITAILRDVRLAVRDFEPMQERVRHMIELARSAAIRYPPQEVGEAIDFLEWLAQLNFVLLGYREYELVDIDGEERAGIRAVPGSGLGILSDVQRSAFADVTPLASLDEVVRARIEGGDLLVFSKTNAYSTVHRRARMDYIGVRIVNAEGVITGEARLIGLFTSKAYMESAAKTPLLHHKLEQILVAEDLIPGSHDYKEAVELFESFPKDELFQAPAEELRRLVVGLLQLEKHGGIRVLVRRDLYGRSVSIVVALPRDRFNAALRKRLQQYFLEQFRGTTVDYHLSLGETESARIFFTVHVEPGTQIPEVPYEQVEAEVERLARSWDDDLHDALVSRVGPERGAMLAEEYAPRFPSYYKASEEWGLIVDDVLALEELQSNPEGFLVRIGNETEGERLTRVRLYKTGGKVDLSAFMPILEALGLRAVEEIPTQVLGEGKAYIHDFGVLDPRGAVLDLGTEADHVAATIAAVWRGEAESDSLNRLVTLSDLDWRQVQILRALRKYRMRVSSRFTEEYRNDGMAAHPQIASALVDLFEARFDPAREASEEEIDEIRQSIHAGLRDVTSLDQDNILRSLLGTIEAIVRTNAYVPGRTSLSFKLRSARVPEMPKPHPLFEIFVYSPQMEAIHLRGGMIARGGIRWSDRKEDYRTEVLGLMKAQKVKNAVIVPDGSKGGFILRRTPASPDELKAEVVARYVTFMQGMLDITDNLVDGEVVHPDLVRVHDGEDAYLVVAADKGTATFSDTANAVSLDYGFWLGDAFASGGSQGYDHKSLGITARGAWESVKRHFREIGIDVTAEPFTVVGIGDMSGDVFGNGMLYTPQIKLVCAFDHRHVFVDPDPDPASSFAERQRLFSTPGSTWADYDRSLMSAGGDVLDRAAKSVTLSPQARAALGLSEDVPAEMTPAEVIHHALQAPLDLLWNGGIGTYVKASAEGHTEVGDRANDPVRVNGAEVRARVVGEGGNLGFTQRGRIEYARTGGRINTDFIDNSAGVDTSDHEVNIKILLGLAVQRGELTMDERNELMQACASDVVAHVLYDNYQQAQILSQEMEVSAQRVEAYEDLMQQLEAGDGELEREVEFLPSSDEMVERRAAAEGLVRPELAVLLAYAKRAIFDALVESDLPDSPYLAQDLRAYFPASIVERFDHLIDDHPLRRELVATIVANDVVNSQGITFVSRMVTETGASPADVVRAYRIARDVTGAVQRWSDVEALDGLIDPAIQNEVMTGVDWLVETTSRWYLVHASGQQLAEPVEDARASFEELSGVIDQIGPEAWREEHEHSARRLEAEGVPGPLARRHAFQAELVHGPDIITVSHTTGRTVLEVARAFFLLGERLQLDWLEKQVEAMPGGSRWQRWALQSMEDDLFTLRRTLAEVVLDECGGLPIDEAVDKFMETRDDALTRLQRFLRSLAVDGMGDLAQLTVALRQIRSLVG
ncbi:MAG TPA: NAD-glutamate dehydrogenase [Actinomycetota bacterium]|nr:NAD-glutamate dehydrogenase [Actinomycetota bacterium]